MRKVKVSNIEGGGGRGRVPDKNKSLKRNCSFLIFLKKKAKRGFDNKAKVTQSFNKDKDFYPTQPTCNPPTVCFIRLFTVVTNYKCNKLVRLSSFETLKVGQLNG